MMNDSIVKMQEGLRKFRENGGDHTKEYNLIKQAKKNPSSLRKAIDAMCFHCFGGTEDDMPDSGWRQSIRDCSSYSCPLWHHRKL